jgi:hypothetical protein
VEWIRSYLTEFSRRTDVVGQATNRHTSGHTFHILPLTKEVNQEVGLEPLVEQLGEEVEITDERRLQDDRNVRGVEQLDRVGSLVPSNLLTLDRQVHLEALEVDHNEEDKHGA